MEILELVQIGVFSLIAYALGYISGRKEGFIKAYQEMPVTVLKISNELSLEKENNDVHTKKY